MKFILSEVTARLLNVNPRPELHGQDTKLAADLKLEVKLPNAELAQFDPRLKGTLYEKSSAQGDLVSGADPDHMTQLRFPQLGVPIKWAGEQVGGKLTVHRGISAKSDLVLDGVLVNEFRLEPLEGGTVSTTFRAQIHPDEKEIGKLCTMTGTDIVISVEPAETDGESLLPPGGGEEPKRDPVLLERTKDGDKVRREHATKFKDTEATVRRVLCEQLGVNMGELAPERSLADLGADSLDHIEMAMALEEEFTIEIATRSSSGDDRRPGDRPREAQARPRGDGPMSGGAITLARAGRIGRARNRHARAGVPGVGLGEEDVAGEGRARDGGDEGGARHAERLPRHAAEGARAHDGVHHARAQGRHGSGAARPPARARRGRGEGRARQGGDRCSAMPARRSSRLRSAGSISAARSAGAPGTRGPGPHRRARGPRARAHGAGG
jgi:acyl carrier protein